MASIYNVACTNNACQYQFSVTVGSTMMGFAKEMELQEDMLAGNIYAPEKIK